MVKPADLLDSELRRDAGRPFITMYDARGGRVELSVATTANWVAKTAGYLEDEVGVEPGDVIAIAPTSHWLTAVALLAGWAVGAKIEPAGTPVEVPLDPMGGAFNRLVAAYPDRYASAAQSEVGEPITALPSGARLLTILPLDATGIDVGLLAPLAAGGSVVYAPEDADIDAIATTEHVTHTAGVDVPGLPRLC